MLKTNRGTVVALASALFVVMAACGGDDDGNGNGNGNGHIPGGSDGNVRNGTWRVTTETSSSGCLPDSTFVAEEEICNLETRFEGELIGSIACDVDIDGNTYQVACGGDSSVRNCNLHIELEAEGTYTDTTYTFLGRAVFTFSGACAQPRCTLDVDEVGEWINTTADCEDDTTTTTAGALSPVLSRTIRRILAP